MKKLIAFTLSLITVLGLVGCVSLPDSGENTKEPSYAALQTDIDQLEAMYAGRTAYHGELHDHADTGGRSDGKQTLDTWKTYMSILDIDFATIVDHKQVRHMYLDEWDETRFIGGTEAAVAVFRDGNNAEFKPHYNMIMPSGEALIEVLEAFTEFGYTGGDPLEAEFPYYPGFTKERFGELIDAIKEKGGFFAIAHPKSGGGETVHDPLEFWFRDWTALEVIYTYRDTRDGTRTAANYKLWRELLFNGKRVWATAGNDEHNVPSDKGLSTIYATEQHSLAFLDRMRVGDFTAGPVGVRMCVGDTVMGYECDFTDQRVVISVGDFHKSVLDPKHTYRLDVYAQEQIVFSGEVKPDEVTYFAFDAENVMFYRTEVIDVTTNSKLALGNPIWNTTYTPS